LELVWWWAGNWRQIVLQGYFILKFTAWMKNQTPAQGQKHWKL
jgi:hypothetical protein